MRYGQEHLAVLVCRGLDEVRVVVEDVTDDDY
jgi:hypothetical protein